MIVIGSDHGGYKLKEFLKNYMKEEGIDFTDVGCDSEDSVDYPEYAKKVVEKVLEDERDMGVLVCGTGMGMCIAANRYKGIRAALAYSDETARLSKEHNNSNILCLGERTMDREQAKNYFRIWHDTPFTNDERHKKRLDLIEKC